MNFIQNLTSTMTFYNRKRSSICSL